MPESSAVPSCMSMLSGAAGIVSVVVCTRLTGICRPWAAASAALRSISAAARATAGLQIWRMSLLLILLPEGVEERDETLKLVFVLEGKVMRPRPCLSQANCTGVWNVEDR